MKILGLTGYIGSGKTTVCDIFAQHGAKIFNADKCVEYLFKTNEKLAKALGIIYPNIVENSLINKQKLKEEIYKNYEENIVKIEPIIHKFVIHNAKRYIFTQKIKKTKLLILEVPLLYESGMDKLCDFTLFLQCPEEILQQRVLKRDGINEEMFNTILEKQKKYADKDEKSDFIINTDVEFHELIEKIAAIYNEVLQSAG